MSPELHVAANTERNAHSGRRNGWAIASLVFGCVACIPFLSFIAPVLGIWALISLQRKPGMRGHLMAMFGITSGLICSAFWLALVVGVRAPLLAGPVPALQAAATQDIQAFRSNTAGNAAEASDDDIRQFLAAVDDRYGTLLACRTDPDRDPTGAPWEETGMLIPYQMIFEDGAVAAWVRVEIHGLAAQFTQITLVDPALGDLSIPEESESESTDSADTVGE